MQYEVRLAIADAEDIFDVTDLLKPIKDAPGVRIVAMIPRPARQEQVPGTKDSQPSALEKQVAKK